MWKLDLLKILYQKVVVPEAVYDELTANADYEDERIFFKYRFKLYKT